MVDEVTLYRAPTTVADANSMADWLAERIGATVTVRDRFLPRYGDETLAESFAQARVLDPYDPETGNTMLGIVRYEERALEHPESGWRHLRRAGRPGSASRPTAHHRVGTRSPPRPTGRSSTRHMGRP